MSDMTVEYKHACETIRGFKGEMKGSGGKVYEVSLGYSDGPYDYNWHCTCQAFKFYKGDPFDRTCKHIKMIQKSPDYCGWDGHFHEGHAGDDKCPRCGGPVFSYGQAV